MATELEAEPSLELLNEVVINQVLVAVSADDAEAVTADAVARIQRDGTTWLSGTSWRGRPAIRVSLSNWLTTDDDVRRSAAAIREAVAASA
jgi:glutamate/tyrosine decarboxylase-like PLP-dependent enzyme